MARICIDPLTNSLILEYILNLDIDIPQELPSSVGIEMSLLNTLMQAPDGFDFVSDILSADDFFAPKNRVVYDAICDLAHQNDPYDDLMVIEFLKARGTLEHAGGEAHFVKIAQAGVAFTMLVPYAERIKTQATYRKLIAISEEIKNLAYQPKKASLADILDRVESDIFQLGQNLQDNSKKPGPKPVNVVIREYTETMNALTEQEEGQLIGFRTPFTELNTKTGGLHASDLIVLAARPGMGKTSFALNLVCNAVTIDTKAAPVVIFSIEMPAHQIVNRLITSWADINQKKLRQARLTRDEWALVSSFFAHLQNTNNLYIDDSSTLTPNDIRARCRRIAKRHDGKMGIIIIDYLQLMSVPHLSGNRVAEISEISRSLKALARDFDCPVLALSQLNRGLESRNDKRPVMSDLRESGAIEQDADIIMFIYRDDVYNPESQEKGIAELHIKKHRNGEPGVIKLQFNGARTLFSDLAGAAAEIDYTEGGFD